MKIAISGKGGVGKTTLAGLLGRLWARQGKKVLLVDADPSPNLMSMLSIPQGVRDTIVPLNRMDELIADRTGAEPGKSFGAHFRLNPEVEDLIDSLAIPGADGVKLLVLGAMKSGGGGCYCPENVLLKTLINKVSFRDDIVIMDLEAGVEHLGRSTAQNMDSLLIVVEPGMRSIGVLKHIRSMAADIGITNIQVVLNKQQAGHREILTQSISDLDLPIVGDIPFDPAFIASDLGGISPLENESAVSSIHAVTNIMAALLPPEK